MLLCFKSKNFPESLALPASRIATVSQGFLSVSSSGGKPRTPNMFPYIPYSDSDWVSEEAHNNCGVVPGSPVWRACAPGIWVPKSEISS